MAQREDRYTNTGLEVKIFLDTVDVESISALCGTGIVDGITTNPLLLSKSGKPYKELLVKICELVRGPVSIEVVSTEAADMVEEGLRLAEIADNVVVKLPMTFEGVSACSILTNIHKIKVNVTLCFSASQALVAAKAGAFFVSPFMGRVDDIGGSGVALIEDIRSIYSKHSFKTQILAASIRSSNHVVAAAKAGADAATVPIAVFKQMFTHPMTDKGLSEFLDAWKGAGKSI